VVKKKSAIKKVKPEVIKTQPITNEVDSLREYAVEAEQVELLRQNSGWQILERDLNAYRDAIGGKLAYMSPLSKEFDDARILFIASDKILQMVSDYSENKKRAMELLDRIDSPEKIVLDVDN